MRVDQNRTAPRSSAPATMWEPKRRAAGGAAADDDRSNQRRDRGRNPQHSRSTKASHWRGPPSSASLTGRERPHERVGKEFVKMGVRAASRSSPGKVVAKRRVKQANSADRNVDDRRRRSRRQGRRRGTKKGDLIARSCSTGLRHHAKAVRSASRSYRAVAAGVLTPDDVEPLCSMLTARNKLIETMENRSSPPFALPTAIRGDAPGEAN
jgi:hypothetical protein